MVKLFRTELTPTGRPVLLHGEVERGMLDKVDLIFYGYTGGVEELPSEEYRGGYVVLTNYRLIWIGSSHGSSNQHSGSAAGVPCHLPLPAVSDAEHKGGMLVKAARIKLAVRVDNASYPTADPRSVACVAPLKMVCRGPSPETLHTQLMAALERRAWASAPPGLLQQLLPAAALPPAAGGVVAGRVGPRPAGQREQQAGGGEFQPDWAMVEGLCVIGYPCLHAVNAVAATRNAGVQQAVEWLLDHEGSPALDQPSPYLQGNAGAGSSSTAHPSSSHGAAYSAAQPASTAAGGGSFANPLLAGLQQQQQQPAQLLQQRGGTQQASRERLAGGSSGGLYASGSGGTAAVLQAAPLRGGGVAAILQRVQDQVDATGSTMDQAFSDLSQLMRKAEEMVQLAQYFRERVAARREGGEPGEELDAETALDLANLGIVSPVTRDTAGSLYFQELARQLADFLAGPMQRAGGIMPLPDVYCLYNRARGTELISPDDLTSAVKLFPQIRAPFALREFASGVKVVQSLSHSDEAVCKRIAEMVAPQPAGATSAAAAAAAGGAAPPLAPAAASAAAMAEGEAALLASLGPSLTRLQVAVGLGVPLAVAGEHLRMAEARGVVCRDDGPEGLRYWRNFFPDFADSSAAA
ncbi:hypothetical protein ABPG75_008896 [Micractinium tetrahymenae]